MQTLKSHQLEDGYEDLKDVRIKTAMTILPYERNISSLMVQQKMKTEKKELVIAIK